MARPFVESGRLAILTRTKVASGQTEADRVESVLAVNLDDRRWLRIRPRVVIDATELGDLLPPHSALDGEIVIELDGKLEFDAMQNRLHPAESRVRIIEQIAHSTGTIAGMIGGQVMDLEAEHKKPDAETLEYIHRSKTAALITASVVSGGIYAGATETEVANLRSFGLKAGLAFQIADDILDVTQSSEQLGKTAGKDMAAEKATYPALFGIEASARKADDLVISACLQLDTFDHRANTLKSLAHFLVQRKK